MERWSTFPAAAKERKNEVWSSSIAKGTPGR
jgi:hypothetical protein